MIRSHLALVWLLLAGAPVAAQDFRTFVLEGDTQSHARQDGDEEDVPHLELMHEWYCDQKEELGIEAIIGTGDVIETLGKFDYLPFGAERTEGEVVDAAFDITEACGIRTILPNGNHDYYGSCANGLPPAPGCGIAPINNPSAFDAWKAANRPAIQAPPESFGGAFVEELVEDLKLLVLPYIASAAVEAWAADYIARNDCDTFFVLQHHAVNPSSQPSIPTTTAAGRLVDEFGGERIPLTIGGHWSSSDPVSYSAGVDGKRSLFSNFQWLDPLTGAHYAGNVTMLRIDVETGEVCVWDQEVLTGQLYRFQALTCFNL